MTISLSLSVSGSPSHAHMHARTHARVHAHTHTHTCAHTHTHTYAIVIISITDDVWSFSVASLVETLWLDEPSSSTQCGPPQVMDRASRNELVRTVEELREQLKPVSYTHLTLPTTERV